MSVEEQVEADFCRARRRAFVRQVRARLRKDGASDGLLYFDDLRKVPETVVRVYRGMRTVPVGQIGGSVGWCSEFDSDFLPAKANVKEKWKRIDRAFYPGAKLPPVDLYKVGSFYFVLDGHHRLSVAAYHGVKWIDANVTEFSSAGLCSERRDRESA